MENKRRCEVCGKDDILCVVHSSSVGAISFNYCLVCSAIGAEPSIVGEFAPVVTYNSNDDRYYDDGDNHIPIKTESGLVFGTRGEFVEYFLEGFRENEN